jgi:hypothetical protein
MRTEKELLIILRNHLEHEASNGIPFGICHEIDILFAVDTITSKEYYVLQKYMRLHRPKRGKHYNPSYFTTPYWWPKTLLKPRLNWLNDQIKNYHKPKIK